MERLTALAPRIHSLESRPRLLDRSAMLTAGKITYLRVIGVPS
jgi:hypothetical protein